VSATSDLDLLLSQAVAAHKSGQFREAAQLYRRCLESDPYCLPALYYGGVLTLQQAQPADAAKLFQTLSGLEPKRAEVWYHLGLAQQRCGRNAEAERSYREALACSPRLAAAGNNLALLLRARGVLGEAVVVLRAVVQADPERAEYWINLGLALHESDDVLDALNCYRRAERIDPDACEVILNLGRALSDSGDHAGAIQYLQRAIVRFPDKAAQAYVYLGAVLDKMGDLGAAAEAYGKALGREPRNMHALLNLAKVLQAQGKSDAAVESFHMALAIKPDFALAHNSLGNALRDQGRLEAAVESFQKALALRPDLAEAHINLGNALRDQGKLDAAVESLQKALALKPEFALAHSNLGSVLQDQGKIEAAVESFRKALSISPDFAEAYDNLLFLCSYRVLLDPQEYLFEARGWEHACVPAQDRQLARNRDFPRLPVAGRRLRVGYVSGDYRQHAVSYFVERLFAHHDRARIELFAYSTHCKQDAITERLKVLAEHWVPLTGIADTTARERIEADGIDVLIDLSGHTSDNRLGIFARRAAPVQAHYLGYFGSTGLTEMDYWIGDAILTPLDADSHFSEQLWRLPRVWVSYAGDNGAPESEWRPAEDGAVWIGSFNNIRKLTPATFGLWARILQALPEGRLLLKARELADAGNRQRILDDLASHGIPSSRIEFQDWSVTADWSAHMAYYHRLDIALDPVGAVGGGSTTCDALWMGVPVIALAGDRMASRMSNSMLDAIGHREWIARSEQEYLDKVVTLARNPEQRRRIRLSLRGEMARSALCDAKGLASALEDAYFVMFDRWQSQRQ
jgi:protein O-GlcNAc transferase